MRINLRFPSWLSILMIQISETIIYKIFWSEQIILMTYKNGSSYSIMLKYNFLPNQMKEDSLLSSLSNISYHANNHSMDFFNDSAPMGAYPQIKMKPPAEQEQVDLNCLPIFAPNQPNSPKNNAFYLAVCWTGANNLMQGNSDNGSEFPEQDQIKLQPDPEPIEEEQKQVKIEEVPVKIEEPEDSPCEDQIGTVIKNQTKNIPKNYGKAIITYIEKQRNHFQKILNNNGIQYDDLLSQLSKKKKYINTIANLRDLWVDFKYARCMRILSNQFLRKYALQYIFNSRICNYTSHVKYRKRLQQAIETPGSFRHIKQY